jgi:inorganic phosphate transporter, PiT family
LFAFVFGWNNSGLTAGNLSNLINYKLALSLTLVGVFTGFVIAGRSMSSSILGKLVSSTLPISAIFTAIFVSVLMLLILTLLRLPVSLSNCTVGAFAGAALATNTQINSVFLLEIFGSWIAVPFVCALTSFVIYEVVTTVEKSRPLVNVVRSNRIVLLVVVFFVSFALGANNLGLIDSFASIGTNVPLALYIFGFTIFGAAALGMVLFGKMIAQVVGDKIVGLSQMKTLAAMLASAIVTTVLTAFSIPVSLTQVVIGGMLGAGISRRPSVTNTREIGILFVGWTLVTAASTGLTFFLAIVITRTI